LTDRERSGRAGFTQIEVTAALLVFSAGVIMMLGVTRGLSRSLEHAAISSLITAEGQERLDSLTAVSYAGLALGTDTDTMRFRGVVYRRWLSVTQYSPLVKKVDLALEPVSGTGPAYDASTYRSEPW
jgi:Tfp pilus assembly protein PilV